MTIANLMEEPLWTGSCPERGVRVQLDMPFREEQK
jgi:hypothetical protein